MQKRNLFDEINKGFEALASEREEKITLRRHAVDYVEPVAMSAAEVVRVRTKLKVSQQVFAHRFRTEPKTIANWEQGRSKPNAQAAILLRLLERHPELLDEIASL